MSLLYEALARPALFRLGGGDPEAAHERTVQTLARASRRPVALERVRRAVAVFGVEREVFGLRFPNPVGLAAGMDKNGVAVPAWPALGFGFAEIGTVTWHAQPGNPRPRLFRLPASEAIVNRMGFNNEGAQALAGRLLAFGPQAAPLGISIGKSKVTPLAEAVDDYLAPLKVLYPFGDYFAINVSSPNTPGLRELQDRAHLDDLLAALRAYGSKPLLVKIAPDLSDSAMTELLQVCRDRGVDGIIAANTTIGRDGVATADAARAAEAGGLSGRPLLPLALRTVEFVVKESGGSLPVVGVGGILDADDALRFFDAGASLVQVFTGLIYRGPGLVRGINRAILKRSAP